MPHAPLGFQFRSVTASVRESPSAHRLIGHASDSTLQCNSRARGLRLVLIRWHFAPDVARPQHFPRRSTEHAVREFLRNVGRSHGSIRARLLAATRKNPAFRTAGRAITVLFATFARPPRGKSSQDEHVFISRAER